VILSFKGKESRLIWQGEVSRRLPVEIQEAARRKLRMLNAAKTLLDLRVPPANRLEALRGERKGQFSIRVNDQWRICFRFAAGNAIDVEIVDYH
jgi:toxin HigB-1